MFVSTSFQAFSYLLCLVPVVADYSNVAVIRVSALKHRFNCWVCSIHANYTTVMSRFKRATPRMFLVIRILDVSDFHAFTFLYYCYKHLSIKSTIKLTTATAIAPPIKPPIRILILISIFVFAYSLYSVSAFSMYY